MMKRPEEIWLHSKNIPGASGAASPHAIGGLIKAIKSKRPRKILEIGSGVGTLTYTIISSIEEFFGKEYSYLFYTVENKQFCLEQLEKNLKGFEGRYTVVEHTSVLRSREIQFDLIVVDGGGNLPADLGPMSIEGMLERQGLIFIEGDRSYQRGRIKEWFPGRDYVWADSHAAKRYIRWRDQQVGNKGYWLFQFEPAMAERISFFLLRLWDRLIGPRRKLRAILEGLSLC